MLCYRDMTFCTRDCWNMECKRNAKKVDLENLETELPVYVDEFKNCKEYKGNEIDKTVKALKDLSNLTEDAIHGL